MIELVFKIFHNSYYDRKNNKNLTLSKSKNKAITLAYRFYELILANKNRVRIQNAANYRANHIRFRSFEQTG